MTTKVSGSRYLPGTYTQKRHNAEQRAHQYVVEWEQREAQKRSTSQTPSILPPTICFSRKIGVGALEIAEILSQKTDQRVADRLIIEKIAADADLSQKTVTYFDERHPGKMNELGALLFGEKSFIMSDFSRKLFSAVITLAESESTIFVGRGTHLILPRDRVLAVRCISAKEFRIKRVADILGVSEDDARKDESGPGCCTPAAHAGAFGGRDGGIRGPGCHPDRGPHHRDRQCHQQRAQAKAEVPRGRHHGSTANDASSWMGPASWPRPLSTRKSVKPFLS